MATELYSVKSFLVPEIGQYIRKGFIFGRLPNPRWSAVSPIPAGCLDYESKLIYVIFVDLK
jgi:hypothetical protein